MDSKWFNGRVGKDAWLVEAWCEWHQLLLRAAKTRFACIDWEDNPDRGWQARKLIMVPDVTITINHQSITPVPLNQHIRYLGVKLKMDLTWLEQCNSITGILHSFLNAVIRHRLSPQQAISMYRLVVGPSIEYGLRHVIPSPDVLRSWNTTVASAITYSATGILYNERHVKAQAVAAITGIDLPSTLECAIKVSEAFYRLNGSSQSSEVARVRWASLNKGALYRNRLSRVSDLAKSLEWEFSSIPNGPLLSSEGAPRECNTATMKVNGQNLRLVMDWLGTWGHDGKAPSEPVTAYTDGSCGRDAKRSSWAICFADDWFDNNYSTLHEEKHLRPQHIKGSVFSGSNATSYSVGIYDAELQAILRALIAVPVQRGITVYTDSKTAVQAIHHPPVDTRSTQA